MPVVDSAGSDAADVGGLADEGEATLVLAETVCLAETCEGGAGAGLAVRGLECIYLLEHVQIPMIT